MYDTPTEQKLGELPGCGPMLASANGANKPLRQQVFEYVRGAGRAARADVTRALDISPGSATTLTADLITAGYLREVQDAPKEQGRGRPRVALEVVPEAHLVVGVRVSEEIHTAVLADFAGHVLAEAEVTVKALPHSLDAVLDALDTVLTKVLERAGKTLSDISGLGIGLSGIIDHQRGRVPWSPLLSERDVDLRSACSARFGVPVFLDNDANVLTLAELWFGAGRTTRDFVVVTIEGGVGMGLVLNNRLYRGARGMGLELGHTKLNLDGALCRCGQRGCLEAYVADYALVREAATTLTQTTRPPMSPKVELQMLYEKAKDGNPVVQAVFERAGRFLAAGLSNVVQLFDPELIILSGEGMAFDYLHADPVLDEMRALTLSEGRRPIKVEVHRWDESVWARGAVALVLAEVTSQRLGAEAARA